MTEFNFPLDPAETMTIRRIIAPDHVPSKGRGVYRINRMFKPFLLNHGWELVGYPKRGHPGKAYFRSPGGVVAESFTFHVGIPNDEAILRVAGRMIAASATDGHLLMGCYHGSLGDFDVVFYPNGARAFADPSNVISAQQRHRDQSPTLDVGMVNIWDTHIHWLDGLDNPPSWDRAEYFSALTPGLRYRGELVERIVESESYRRYVELAGGIAADAQNPKL